MIETDVLVSGCGPTGAALAALLGRRGRRVLVIDKAAAIYDKPRAITADHEVLRLLQEVGIADEVLAASTPHPGTDYIGLDGQVIKRFYPAPPPHALGWLPNWNYVQPELEAALRRALAALPAVHSLLAHELTGFTQDAGGVQARVRRLADGTQLDVKAQWLVAADGAGSTVRRQLVPAIEDLAFDEWWIVVDAWVRGPVDLPERCVQYCRPSRPGTYIVGPGALRRWEIKILPHETPALFENSHDAVWRVLGEFVDTRAMEHCRTAVYRFHALVVEQWRHGRVLLAGDAAHQMPPFLGQGLCAGMRDAFNLAWKLDAVLAGRARDTLLDSYTPERKRHVRTVVAHAKAFGQIIGELDVDAARERDRALGEALRSGRAETIRQRFIPGLETGLIACDAAGLPLPGAGDLLPQPFVGGSRLDDVLGPGWALIAADAAALQALDGQVLSSWQQLPGVVAVLSGAAPAGALALREREGLLAAWLRQHAAIALVARPDRYVYGAAQAPAALRTLLLQLAGRL